MGIRRVFFRLVIFGALVVSGCDLQPKIVSIPDDIGAFISDRYPALLADPDLQPEIYNSAVTDYGVYASPELYGSSNIDDYVMYASVNDYVLAPQDNTDNVVVTDEIVQNEKENTEEEIEEIIETDQEQDYLIVPTYGGFFEDAIVEKEPEQKDIAPVEDKKIESDEIIIAKGDTLYSVAKKYNTSVEELAKINSLKSPYTLSIGQKLRVKPVKVEQPKIENIISTERVAQIKKESETPQKSTYTSVVNDVKPNAVKRVDLQEIVVNQGDTLYSLSRKYQIPVNDLAVMNKLSSPFTLSVGQKLKVPKLDNIEVRSAKEIKQIKTDVVVKENKVTKTIKQDKQITPVKTVADKKADKVVKPDNKTKKTQPVISKDAKKTQNAKSTPVVKVKTSAKTPVKTSAKTSAKSAQKTKISSNPKQQLPKITARSASKFSWPIRGKILSQYGSKNNGLFNDGINISASQGAAVKAAENGVVAYAGNEVRGMGNLIIIQHSDGWMTVYAHLDSMSVKRGSKVSVGGVIGKIGKTGKVDKPQLHFEIRKGTKAYNPLSYLKK